MNAAKLAVTVGILGIVAGSATQLTDIFSPLGSIAPVVVKEIVSISGFVGGILAFVLAWMTKQSSQVANVMAAGNEPAVQDALVRRVAQYRGVDNISTNSQASDALKDIANDSTVPKVSQPVPGR